MFFIFFLCPLKVSIFTLKKIEMITHMVGKLTPCESYWYVVEHILSVTYLKVDV